MNLLKVLIIEDTIVYRKILHHAVNQTELASVVHTAPNGEIAIERLQQNPYDIVLTDIYMPGMSGLELLEYIKEKHADIVVVVISGGSEDGAQLTIDALDKGALDFIVKPQESKERNMKILTTKIGELFTETLMNRTKRKQTTKVDHLLAKKEDTDKVPANASFEWEQKQADLIVIAASTGGPVALRTLLKKLGVPPHVPVLIVQHMPATFTKTLAQSFTRELGYPVLEAEDQQRIRQGMILLAPGGYHMLVENTVAKESVIRIVDEEAVHGVRPAADPLFLSIAEAYQNRNVIAIILTGMGKDGLDGVKALKTQCHCYCYTQDEATSIIYGMPRAIVTANLSDESFAIHTVPKSMHRFWKGSRG